VHPRLLIVLPIVQVAQVDGFAFHLLREDDGDPLRRIAV
jgi:hypothetical protein